MEWRTKPNSRSVLRTRCTLISSSRAMCFCSIPPILSACICPFSSSVSMLIAARPRSCCSGIVPIRISARPVRARLDGARVMLVFFVCNTHSADGAAAAVESRCYVCYGHALAKPQMEYRLGLLWREGTFVNVVVFCLLCCFAFFVEGAHGRCRLDSHRPVSNDMIDDELRHKFIETHRALPTDRG